MKVDQVPQDDSILEGHSRACYAQDSNGQYTVTKSRGWQVEAIANRQALSDVQEKIARAARDVAEGRASPLAFHMACAHMDASLLAAHTGIWSLRIRRHLRPAVFARLPDSLLQRYANAFGIDLYTLKGVPDSGKKLP
jgi:hypothetical protein